jgi:hypothetical protein
MAEQQRDQNTPQGQIQVGAGLQESRLNTDLIAFLQKYGSPVLTVVLVLVLAYVGWVKYSQHLAQKKDEAFINYAAARADFGTDGVLTGSPDNLFRIADESRGQGAVWELASLDAADICLAAARRGIAAGADLANPQPTDYLTDEQKTELIKKADEAYRKVLDATSNKPAKAPIALRARWGLSSTAASLGEMDRAKSVLNEIVTASDGKGMEYQAQVAKRRAEMFASMGPSPKMFLESELPESARVPKPIAQPSPGQPIKIEGMDQPIMIPAPTPSGATPPVVPVPAPVPAPSEGDAKPAETPAAPPTGEPAKPQ